MVKSLEEYRRIGSVSALSPNEQDRYIDALNSGFKDDLAASEFLLLKHPRWSIISGYYAMHDVSKFFLAKTYGLKLSQPYVHAAVIDALRELVKRKDILELIRKAEKEYEEIISVHFAMARGREEREKSQYYTDGGAGSQKAAYFLDKLVKPYIKLLNKMMNDDSQHPEQ